MIFEPSEVRCIIRGNKVQSELGEAQLNKFEITRGKSYFRMCKLYNKIVVLYLRKASGEATDICNQTR